jgi:hypothetical protein
MTAENQQAEQRPMWKSLLRGLLPMVLFCGAVGLLVYGARFHLVPVSHEEEIEVSLGPPPLFPPPPLPGEPPFGEPGGEPPFVGPPLPGAPPPFLQSIKTKVIVAEDESEPTLIREVTFGGVARLGSGELKRTYTGQPPSLCPT